MKTTPLNRAVQAIAASALLSFASAGWAATTWNVNTCTGTNAVMGNSFSCASSGDSTTTAATVTGWGTNGNTAASTFAAGALSAYSFQNSSVKAFGVENATETTAADSPEHSMDNNLQTDLISLNFGSASVALNTVSTAWAQTDSDMSVLRFDSTSGFTASIANKSIAQLLATGWKLVADLSGTGVSSASYTFNNTGTVVSSSWWLVSAYNAAYSGGTSASGNDYVKVMSVAGSVVPRTDTGNRVPEPGSLALIGLGLLGLIGTSRRRQAKGLAA